MGRKKLLRPSSEELVRQLSVMLVPEFILMNFDIYGTEQFKEYWLMELREKEDRLPEEMSQSEDAVLDGFCTPLQVLSHSFSGKPVYLKIYRRRWKKAGTDKFYSNDYDFTLKGLRMVPELGIFLKE